jgi:hypothetical protein
VTVAAALTPSGYMGAVRVERTISSGSASPSTKEAAHGFGQQQQSDPSRACKDRRPDTEPAISHGC